MCCGTSALASVYGDAWNDRGPLVLGTSARANDLLVSNNGRDKDVYVLDAAVCCVALAWRR
jgi:hypothetical protein